MTIAELIDRYHLMLSDSPEAIATLRASGKQTPQPGQIVTFSPLVRSENALDEIRAKKPEIIAELRRRAEEKAEADRIRRERLEERQRKIDAIEGLAEIRAAKEDLRRWHAEFEASFEGEDAVGGMGVRQKPAYDIPAMLAAHPQAAAFLKAEELANKTNYELSAIGRKALEEVIFGDWEKALADMEAEREAFVERHIWD